MNSRQQTILQMIIDQGQVSVTDLVKATGVSEATIRQGLSTLEKLSYLQRAHGFAVSLDSNDVETRVMSNYTLKRELVEFITSLVQLGETIFIENGSNSALLARTLGEQKKNAAIITVSSCTTYLPGDTSCEAILPGGVYQKKSESMVGPLTCQCIQQVHPSKAFTGINGWRPETGLTGRDMMRTDVVNTALEKEYEAIALTDSSKFGAVHPYSIGPVERFNRMITDSKVRANDLMYLEHSKLAVRVADTQPLPFSMDDLQFGESSALR